jgi:hypothetical protein
MIEQAIRSNIQGKHERIKQKYMWLGLYHNEAVQGLSKRLGESSAGKNLDQFLILSTLRLS